MENRDYQFFHENEVNVTLNMVCKPECRIFNGEINFTFHFYYRFHIPGTKLVATRKRH